MYAASTHTCKLRFFYYQFYQFRIYINMNQSSKLSRRSFLKYWGNAGGTLLAGCRPLVPVPTGNQVDSACTGWIARAGSYEPGLVRKQVESLFDSLGGLQDVVRPGDKAVIKVNLTGGVKTLPPPAGATPPESYVTHPSVAPRHRRTAAGGRRKRNSHCGLGLGSGNHSWIGGYVDMAHSLGARLIDLNGTEPYRDLLPFRWARAGSSTRTSHSTAFSKKRMYSSRWQR